MYMEVELWPNNADKNRGIIGKVLGNTLGTWGTFWEPDGNLMGPHWEHVGRREKTKDPPLP